MVARRVVSERCTRPFLRTSSVTLRSHSFCYPILALETNHNQAEGDDSPARALRDPILRPSERKAKHDALLEQRRKNLGGIEARIAEAETKAERLGARLEATGVVFDSFGEAAALSASGVGEGWVSYLDEESGQYYWYNDLTGEAYYD